MASVQPLSTKYEYISIESRAIRIAEKAPETLGLIGHWLENSVEMLKEIRIILRDGWLIYKIAGF